MSEFGIAVIAAFAGGLSTFLLGLSAQSRADFAFRAIAIGAVRDEFAAARRTIASARVAKGLWLPSRSLPGDAWETHGHQLSSFLSDGDLEKVKTVRSLLCSVDASVKRIQKAAGEDAREQAVPADQVTRIERLDTRLEEAIEILDGVRGDAKSELRRTRRVSGAAVLAIIGAVAISALLPVARGALDQPAVTESSAARQLQAELPGSNQAICDESTVFEGAFRCAVDFGGCHSQLEASTGGPSCPVPKQSVWNMLADEDCYEATEIALIEDGAPAPDVSGKPEREEFRANCIDD